MREGPERRILSVLFADIVGFTSLSERLDPEDVAIVQERYFQSVRSTIERYGGAVEKLMGDGLLAAFGLPRAHDDDAERAVRAGLALANAAERVSAELGLDPPLRVRVGVNTGEVVRTAAAQEPLTGDTMNVASRLQSAAEPGQVVIGEATALAVEAAIAIVPIGPLLLKGKAASTHAWRALAPRAEPSREHALGGLRADSVGRGSELARLLGMARAAGGASAGALVVAPPGLGKSRLLEDLARALGDSMSVLRARLRPDRSGPYDEIVQVLRAALGVAGAPADRDAVAARIESRARDAGASPGRARILADAVAAMLWPGTVASVLDRDQLFDAVIEATDALSAPQPSLWLIEDVHWASADVLAFLERATTLGSAPGRLVMMSARPALLDEHRGAGRGWTVLELQPLPATATADLIRGLVGDALPAELQRIVCERADGNPLFVEELLRTWANVGQLVPHGAGWRMAVDPREVAVPATVQAIYAGQLDDLPPPARGAARRGSIAGRRFPARALEALEAADGDEGISTLVRRALVSGPEARPVHGPLFTFRHALLRDAGYSSLGRAERAVLHVRYARWLEGSAGASWRDVADEIAGHYSSAYEVAPALASAIADGLDRGTVAGLAAHWLERAGDGAAELAAHDTAERHYRRAADLTPEATPRRSDLLLKLGRAATSAGHLDAAGEAYRLTMTAHRRALAAADPAHIASARAGLALAARGLGEVWNQQLLFHDAERLATESLAEIVEAEDAPTARLLLLRALARLSLGTAGADDPDVERALRIARSLADRDLEVDALEARTGIRFNLGIVTDDEIIEIDRLARERGRFTWMLNRVALLADDRASIALTALDEAEEIAEARGLAVLLGWIGYDRAEVLLVLGEWDRALDVGLRTIDRAERDAQHRIVVRTWYVVTVMAVERGASDLLRRAHDWHERHRAFFPDSGYGRVMHTSFDLRMARAGIIPAFVPDPARMAEGLELEHVTASWLLGVREVVGAYIGAGRTSDAAAAIELISRTNARTRGSALGRGTEDLLRAELDVALGDAAAAGGHARAALASFRSAAAPWFIVLALRVLVGVGVDRPGEADELTATESSLLGGRRS